MRLLPYEIWRDIPGFEGKYRVSTEGNVETITHLVLRDGNSSPMTIKSRRLKQQDSTKGYPQVRLYKNKVAKTYRVHHLVMLAFRGPKPLNMQVNHIDENKHNNSLWNLEYCDVTFNSNWGTRNKRIGEFFRNGPTSKPVTQFDLEGNFISTYPSMCEASRQTGTPQSLISKCCNGKSRTGGGYIWRYT